MGIRYIIGVKFIKGRMINISREARKINKAPFLHVIVQGINKENIFKEERYKNQYLKLLKKECEKYNIKIIAYCIMDNHAHFLLNINEIEEISRTMQKVNCIYAKYYNYMNNGRKGYVFRDRYVSEPIDSKKYLINCIKYIHMNPVKAKIVKYCREYKFSSYNFYNKKFLNNELIENEIFSKSDYKDIIENIYTNYVFEDMEENSENKIKQGILEFTEKEQVKLFEIFFNREVLINLIKFLKNIKKIKYVQIREKLGITRGTMETLTKVIRDNK